MILFTILILLPHLRAESFKEYICTNSTGLNYSGHDLYADGIRIQNARPIVFQVKCAHKAYMLLHQLKNDYKINATEVRLQVKEKFSLMIDEQSHHYDLKWDPNLLSASEYRNFWISWNYSKIHFGKGGVPYRNPFLYIDGISYDMNYISIGTVYTYGYWRFKVEEEGEEGEEGGVGIAVYVAVPIAIIAIVLTTVIVCLVLRKKLKKKENDESAAVYNEIDLTPRNRQLVQGIDNRAYDSRILEEQENTNCSSDEILESNASLYTKITLDEKRKTQPDRSVYTKITLDENQSPVETLPALKEIESVNSNPKDIFEDGYGYNHLMTSAKALSDLNYSHVLIAEEEGKAEDDTSYAHIAIREDGASHSYTKIESKEESTYNRLCTTPKPYTRKQIDTPKCSVNQDSVYDHAKAGGRDPENFDHAKVGGRDLEVYERSKEDGRDQEIYDHAKAGRRDPEVKKANEYSHLFSRQKE